MKPALKLLKWALPPTATGRSTLGDVLEEYASRPPGLTRHIWLWGITFDLVLRYVPSHLGHLIGGAGRDLRYAARLARRQPVLSLVAVLSLSVAIAVSTMAFSLANVLWLRPALSVDPAIVRIWRQHARGVTLAWPWSELAQLRDRARTLKIEAAYPNTEPIRWAGASVTPIETEMVAFVSGQYFSILQTKTFAGRLVEPADDRVGAPPVIVLDHSYWRRHLGGDPSVLGRIVSIRGTDFTVAGIADRDFIDPTGRQPVMWAALTSFTQLAPIATPAATPRPFEPLAVGRLNSGMSIKAADTDLSSLLKTITPGDTPRRATGVITGHLLSDAELSLSHRLLAAVFSVIALVLVLACANVSNLLLASAAARRQETAVRLSCGASRRRVAWQAATETALLGLTSGLVGYLMAWWLAPVLAIAIGLPEVDVDPDARVHAFAALATVVTVCCAGLAPAYYRGKQDLSGMLSGSPTGRSQLGRPRRASAAFVAIQAAASIVLVTLAALQLRALVQIAWVDPGFDLTKLLSVSAPPPRTAEDETRAVIFWTSAIERVRSLPGVEWASLADYAPFGETFGNPDADHYDETDAEYFSTIGLPIIRGRGYTALEVVAHAKVVVLSEQKARKWFGSVDPVGASAAPMDPMFRGFQVIGVVKDAFVDRVYAQGPRMAYLPFRPSGFAQIVVRTRNPAALAPVVLNAVRELAPEMHPTVTVTAAAYAHEFERPRRMAALAASIAGVGLLLSIVGVFGVTAYAVGTRMREVGIRIALGARRQDVTRMFVRDGLRPVLIGSVAGFMLALMAGHAAAGLLYGLSDRDPLALTAAILIILGAALAATVIPTRRAARLDPAAVLRDI